MDCALLSTKVEGAGDGQPRPSHGDVAQIPYHSCWQYHRTLSTLTSAERLFRRNGNLDDHPKIVRRSGLVVVLDRRRIAVWFLG